MNSTTKKPQPVEINARIAADQYIRGRYASHGAAVVYVREDIEAAFAAGAAWHENNLAIADVRLHTDEAADRVIATIKAIVERGLDHSADRVVRVINRRADELQMNISDANASLKSDVGKSLGQLDGTLDDLQLEVLGVRNLVEAVHGLKIEVDAVRDEDLAEKLNPYPYGVHMEPGEFGEGATVAYPKTVRDVFKQTEKRPPLQPGQLFGLDVVLNDQGVDALIARDLREHGAAFISVRADGTRKVFDPRDVIIQVKPSSEG